MGRRTTLKDVAREAGVTAATVSYVINDTPGQSISAETRRRVMDAVGKLHYAPNAHARTLRSKSSPCVGVVITKNLAVPRFSQTVYGLQSRLSRDGYSVLLLEDAPTPAGYGAYVNAYLAGRVEGIVFLGKDNVGPDERSVQVLAEEKAPFVVFDCQSKGSTHSSVDLDYEGGAQLVAERVLESRPRHVLYFRPDMDNAQEELRERGVQEACEAAGVELIVRRAPITQGNLDTWDARYSVGDTEEGLELTDRFLECVCEALGPLEDGDAVISSWATWTHYFRKATPNRRLTYAELANNGESWIASNFYTRMPNFEAGVTCAEEILSLMRGGVACARNIRLSNIVEATMPAKTSNASQPTPSGMDKEMMHNAARSA